MLEVIFHQSLSVGHDPRRRGAPLGAAPVPARLPLVLVEQATRAAAAEEHEDQEDEHHGGQHDANNAADAGVRKEIRRQLVQPNPSFTDILPVANFVDAVLNLSAAIRSPLELAAAAAIHLAGVVVGARAGEEGGVVVDALLAAS